MGVICRFLKDESGMEFSEYAVAAALVIIAIVIGFTQVGSAIVDRIATVTGIITT